MESEQRWFYAKHVYPSGSGIHLEFHTEAEAHDFLVDGRRRGCTRNWRIGSTVTIPFPKTQPPAIAHGIEFQRDL
ncbi:MAG: hypothetical protein F6K28_49835 [Microcoleus sp. SIO2G3]|nr:hypothetical protein [Microcoleus sp. SIO2G3]